jgi:hypothetical protein
MQSEIQFGFSQAGKFPQAALDRFKIESDLSKIQHLFAERIRSDRAAALDLADAVT